MAARIGTLKRRLPPALLAAMTLVAAETAGEAANAIRERANVQLGYYLLDHHDYEHGRAALVRTQRTKGRLGAGWLEYESGKQDAAVKHWASLAEGDGRDTLVHETRFVLPRVQYQLKDYSAATLGYEKALRSYAD